MRIGLIPLICLTCLVFISSCDQASLISYRESARVILPAQHPAIALATRDQISPNGFWTLVWYDETGSIQTIRHIPESAKSVTIDLKRGVFTPILLYPESDSMALAPAGAIYPVDGTADPAETISGEISLKPDWRRGILADCAKDACLDAKGGFAEGRTIAAHFNWARCARILEAMPNPVLLDRERLVAAILAGSVSVYSITKRNAAEITLDSVHPESGGRFVARNPEEGDIIWPETGSPTISLADGHTTYFGESGTIELEVSGGTLLCGFFLPYTLQD